MNLGAPMWTTGSAQKFIATIRESLLHRGWLTYLGGSVMYRGESHNNLDLILVPREHVGDLDVAIHTLRQQSVRFIGRTDDFKGRTIIDAEHQGRSVEIVLVNDLGGVGR